MINAGVPSWRVKVCAGSVLTDPVTTPSESDLGGHGWTIYLADRSDSERGLEWVILDWCYLQDPDVAIEDKPLAGNGGKNNAYKEIWFTFNDENSWSQVRFSVKTGRISNNRKTKKDEVLTTLEDLMRNLAKEQIEDVLKKYGLRQE